MTKSENPPVCYECHYHTSRGWQDCDCLVCIVSFHDLRCLKDKRGPCVFYKDKEEK